MSGEKRECREVSGLPIDQITIHRIGKVLPGSTQDSFFTDFFGPEHQIERHGIVIRLDHKASVPLLAASVRISFPSARATPCPICSRWTNSSPGVGRSESADSRIQNPITITSASAT